VVRFLLAVLSTGLSRGRRRIVVSLFVVVTLTIVRRSKSLVADFIVADGRRKGVSLSPRVEERVHDTLITIVKEVALSFGSFESAASWRHLVLRSRCDFSEENHRLREECHVAVLHLLVRESVRNMLLAVFVDDILCLLCQCVNLRVTALLAEKAVLAWSVLHDHLLLPLHLFA